MKRNFIKLFLLIEILSACGTSSSPNSATEKKMIADPEAFGLSPASSDNAQSLQAAIDQVAATGGGTVLLATPGTYVVSRINPKSGVSIVCANQQVVLKAKDGFNADLIYSEYTIPVNDVRISGCSIDGNKANNPGANAGTAIHFGGTNIEVDNMNIYNTPAAGIILGIPGGGGQYRIHHNLVTNASVERIGWGGIAVTGGEDVVISDNVVKADGCQAYGINLEPNPGWVVRKALITRNYISKGRISVGVNYPTGVVEDVIVSGNWVDVLGAFGSVYDSGGAIYCSRIGGGLSVSDNTLYGPDTSSGVIRVQQCDNFSIKGNNLHIRDHASPEGSEIGLWVVDSRYGTVNHNRFSADASATPRFGIIESGTSDYNDYSFNSFYGITDPYGACCGGIVGAHNRYN